MKSEFRLFLIQSMAFALVMYVGLSIMGLELRVAGVIAGITGLLFALLMRPVVTVARRRSED